MIPIRQSLGGLGNLMFKNAYVMGRALDGRIPDVYVQGEKYWERHKDAIRGFYRIGIGDSIPKVGLHIRRGDYLKAEHFHVDLSKTDYYQKAVKMFPGKEFLVFCKDNQGNTQDVLDRQWVRNFLDEQLNIKCRWEFAPFENSEVEDMNMMAACESLIMANSSFSWWGAYLNDNPHKVIVCPSRWFVDKQQRTELLDEWLKI